MYRNIKRNIKKYKTMNTITVRPILVKKNNKRPKIGDICKNAIQVFIWSKEHEMYNVLETLPEYKNTEVQKLILISLDSKDKLNINDKVYLDLGENSRITTIKNLNGSHPIFNIYIDGGCAKRESLKKIIAKQSQIPSEYISKFIDEYNTGMVNDIKIKGESILCNNEINFDMRIYSFNPKLKNGFITIDNENIPENIPLSDIDENDICSFPAANENIPENIPLLDIDDITAAPGSIMRSIAEKLNYQYFDNFSFPDNKILYWAKQLSNKSLSTHELVENVKWLINKIAYTEDEVKQLFIRRANEFSPSSKPFGDLLLRQDLEWFNLNKK